MPDKPPCSPFAKSIAICLMIAACTSGCTSMRPVRGVNAPTPPQGFVDIRPGDRVAVEMKDGRRERFRVQHVDGDALISPSGHRYGRAEMVQLSRQQLSHAKTLPLIAVTVFFGIGLTAMIAWYA